MKSAVHLAHYELGNVRRKEEIAEKDKRINELEQELANVKEHHAKIISEKAYQHFNRIRECEAGYANLLENHRQEMKAVKKEMANMRNVHNSFLESYAEASLDALRNTAKSNN